VHTFSIISFLALTLPNFDWFPYNIAVI
jgi:hypothetical protein